jgi:hypothetical protein
MLVPGSDSSKGLAFALAFAIDDRHLGGPAKIPLKENAPVFDAPALLDGRNF